LGNDEDVVLLRAEILCTHSGRDETREIVAHLHFGQAWKWQNLNGFHCLASVSLLSRSFALAAN
jgi:hypothetical protein